MPMRTYVFRSAMYLSLVLGLMFGLNASASTDYASLRQEIEAANLSGTGSITLLSDINLGASLPPITGDVVIDGDGYSISGVNEFRIFVVDGGKLTIKNMTLADGSSPEDGGAILLLNDGALVVESVTFTGNESAKGGGAISTSPSDVRLDVSNSVFDGNSAGSGGGAILVFGGSAEISGSSFHDNFAGRFGGGVEAFVGEVNIWNSTFVGNQAGQGGAILASGAKTTLTHLTLVENRALWGEGDAIHVREGQAYLRNSIVAGGGAFLDCSGRPLAESSGNFSEDGACAPLPGGDPMLAEITGSPAHFPLRDGSPAVDAAESEYCSEVDQRGEARPQGGGCDIGAFESASATAATATPVPTECTLANHILSANTNTSVGGCPTGTSHDVITITEDITLEAALPPINGTITIEGNGHRISGGNQFRIFVVAGRRLTINNLTLAQGRAEGEGGAIVVLNNAELVVNKSTFENNSIQYIELGDDRIVGGYGGAIGTRTFHGKITINESVFSGNKGQLGGGAIYFTGGTLNISGSTFTRNEGPGFGGAIEVSGGQVNIENSTFYLNSSSNGGAVSITGGDVTMTHLSLVGNRSSYAAGMAIRHFSGSAQLRNSIVSGRRGLPDCHGDISFSGNFSQDGSCGSARAGDPQLGKMTGAPGYFPPLENSPVLDAADPAYCLETDQIGRARPQGAGCDIGAIESAFEVSSAGQAQAAEDESGEQAFADCSVTTTDVLNFRDGPAGDWIGLVPANTTVTAMARTPAWFNVIYKGRTGWISASYVTTAGACG